MGLVRDYEGVRAYDFQRSHQLSRAQLDAVMATMTMFWRNTANFLSSYLRTPLQLQHLSVEQVMYEDMIQTIKAPTVLGIFTSSPNVGNSLFECSPIIALAMIDRALGGPGVGDWPGRRLTQIEQSIVRHLLNRMLRIYADVWNPMMAIEPVVTSMEHSPAFSQIAGEGDLVVVARQQVTLDGHRGQLTMVWPYTSIMPLAEASIKFQLTRDGSLDNVQVMTKEMKRHVEMAPIRAAVVLGKTDITVSEFSQLKVGDALVLKNRYDQPLTLRMGNRNKFQVLPGKSRGHLAVRVISRTGDE